MMQACEQQGESLQAVDQQEELEAQKAGIALPARQIQSTKVTQLFTCMFACTSAT